MLLSTGSHISNCRNLYDNYRYIYRIFYQYKVVLLSQHYDIWYIECYISILQFWISCSIVMKNQWNCKLIMCCDKNCIFLLLNVLKEWFISNETPNSSENFQNFFLKFQNFFQIFIFDRFDQKLISFLKFFWQNIKCHNVSIIYSLYFDLKIALIYW